MEELTGTNIGGCEVQSLIGKGGMGAVYKGMQLSLQRPVAIKILSTSISDNQQYIDRFMREAQIVALVNHPNIIQIYDTGEKDGTYYIIMEYIEGRELSTMIKEGGALGRQQTVDIALQVAKGLDAAWKQKVIHRDIKPENILLTGTDTVKIADFGLAKGTGELDSLTMTGQVMGTPYYMSPEQCRGEATDFRTDVYALGITIYYMLSAHAPFTGNNTAEVIFKHINSSIPVISEELNDPRLADIDFILKKCLAKDKSNRYNDYSILIRNLEMIQRGESLTDNLGATAADMPVPGSQNLAATQITGTGGGAYTCPSCHSGFDADLDFYNEVACPHCSARHNPGQGSVEEVGTPSSEGEEMMTRDPVGRNASRVLSVETGPETEESIEARVGRVILMEPEDTINVMLRVIDKLKADGRPHKLLLPANMLLRPDGTVDIIDSDLEYSALTADQASFASPEATEGVPATTASDVYSLGMIMTYMVSGRLSIESKSLDAIKEYHLGSKNDLIPSKLNPSVSQTLERIIRMMVGAGGERRIESLDTLSMVLGNELRRIKGEEIEDLITSMPVPEAAAKNTAEASKDAPQQPVMAPTAAPISDPDKLTHITCSECAEWNTPDTYVCKGCGKLFVDENPDAAPESAKEYLEVGQQLFNKVKYEASLMILKEGQGRHFSHSNLAEMVQKVEKAIEGKNVKVMEEKAADYAGKKQYKAAIREWEKAGNLDEEAKTRNIEKIKWARGIIRRSRMIKSVVLLIVIVGAAAGYTVLNPEQVIPPVNALLKRINITISYLEQFEPKGLDVIDVSQLHSFDEIFVFLEDIHGKGLSAEEQKVQAQLQQRLVELFEAKTSVLKFRKYTEYVERSKPLLQGHPGIEQVLTQHLKAINTRIGECMEIAETDRAAAVKELQFLVPYASGSMLEKRLFAVLEEQKNILKREANPEMVAKGRAWLQKARAFEKTGDFNNAILVYQKMRDECKDDVLFPGICKEGEAGLKRIAEYQEAAKILLSDAERLLAAGKTEEAMGRYTRIVKKYPFSEAARDVRFPLTVSAEPLGTGVFLDGTFKGTVPLMLYLSPRSNNRLELKLDGYNANDIIINEIPFTPDTPWKYSAAMLRAPSRIIALGGRVYGFHKDKTTAYIAMRDSIVAVDPEGGKPAQRFALPAERPDAGRKPIINFLPASDGFNYWLLENKELYLFNPLLGKIDPYNTLPYQPQSGSMVIDRVYPSRDTGIFFWGPQSRLYGLNLSQQSLMWTRSYMQGSYQTQLTVFKDLLIAQDPKGGKLLCIDTKENEIKLSIPIEGDQLYVTLDAGELFILNSKGTIVRFNLIKSRSEIWRISLPEGNYSKPLLLKGGSIVALGSEGNAICLQRLDGKLKWQKTISKHPLEGGVFLKNTVYIYDLYGTMYALSDKGVVQQYLYGKYPITTGIHAVGNSLIFADKADNLVIYTF